MPIQQATQKEDLFFIHLPALTKLIRDEHIEAFVHAQLRISRELNLPILKFFSHLSEQEMIARSIESSRKFLDHLAENNAFAQLEQSLDDWKNNRLIGLSQDQIIPDDLFLITRMRKKAFMEMVKLYTTDINIVYAIIDELDKFFLAFDREATKVYIEILQERIEENSYFKEKLAEISPGFYYTYDIKNDRQVQKTEKLFRYLGYVKEEYEADDRFFRKLIHPADIEQADKYVNDIKDETGKAVHFFEYRLKNKQGGFQWMRNYESIFKRDKAGRSEYILGVAFDITEEHRITEQLKRRESELLEAQELANIGSYLWDFKGDQNYHTPQTQKILGLAENEKYEDMISKIHPSDRKQVREGIQKAINGEGIFDAEFRIIVNEMERIVWGRGIVNFEKGEAVTMKGTVMDVTDRHYMVMKLKRSEELYKQAQTLNKTGNWTWEIIADKLQWSDELYRIYGLEPQSEIMNFEKFSFFIHPDDREERIRLLQEQLTDTSVKDYYFRIVLRDKTEKILYGQSQVLVDEQGIPYKLIGTCQDVTVQKELENTLYKRTQQLERSNESLEEFAYISSHDLKEPLRKISVFMDILFSANKNKFDADSKITAGKIVSATSRMQRMVDEILSLSRISADHSFVKYNLNTLLDEVVALIESDLAEKEAKIIYKNLPDALINEIQIRQLFLNLISNSLKFMQTGKSPKITITYQYLPGNKIRPLHLDVRKKYLEIKYKDNGIGFGAESESRIFTIFHRLHSRDKYEGTGIGLAICKKIVEHHQGIILAKGEEGKGAEFTIIIPA